MLMCIRKVDFLVKGSSVMMRCTFSSVSAKAKIMPPVRGTLRPDATKVPFL